MSREQTFYEAMEELHEAWHALISELLPIIARLLLMPLRFIWWLNGDD